MFKKRSIDSTILVNQAITCLKVTKVLVEHVQLEISNANHRTYSIDEEEVLFRQSLDHLAELTI